MSLYWTSLCRMSLYWMSLCWVLLYWMSLCWVLCCHFWKHFLLSIKVPLAISKTANLNCVTVPRIPMRSSSTGSGNLHRLPVRIPDATRPDGRIFVRTSKTVFFNRIAKTGSQAFIALLYKLESVNNFKVKYFKNYLCLCLSLQISIKWPVL